jgi:hypothetical protein
MAGEMSNACAPSYANILVDLAVGVMHCTRTRTQAQSTRILEYRRQSPDLYTVMPENCTFVKLVLTHACLY